MQGGGDLNASRAGQVLVEMELFLKFRQLLGREVRSARPRTGPRAACARTASPGDVSAADARCRAEASAVVHWFGSCNEKWGA